MCNTDIIVRWLQADAFRMEVLQAVSKLDLPDWLIAAGFVRNLIWDKQHGISTPLNDVDIIYYDKNDATTNRDLAYEVSLNRTIPDLPCSVKNQARMHFRNGDQEYKSTQDAMKYWPETQTAIGAMINSSGNIEIRHSFNLEKYFNYCINHNPLRKIEIFNNRVNSKKWLTIWKKLSVET